MSDGGTCDGTTDLRTPPDPSTVTSTLLVHEMPAVYLFTTTTTTSSLGYLHPPPHHHHPHHTHNPTPPQGKHVCKVAPTPLSMMPDVSLQAPCHTNLHPSTQSHIFLLSLILAGNGDVQNGLTGWRAGKTYVTQYVKFIPCSK